MLVETKNQFPVADSRKTTSLLKKYLKQKYGIVVSIKSKKYSGGSSLSVRYRGGVDKRVIENELSRLEYGNFDGMTDSYDYKDKSQVGLVIDGYLLYNYKYVFVEQDFNDEPNGYDSDVFWSKVAKAFSDKYNYADIPPFDGDLSKDFSERYNGAWNWWQLVRRLVVVKNFVCQDIENVTIVDVYHDSSQIYNNYTLVYEYQGKIYTTDKFVKLEKETKKSVTKEKTINVNGVKMIDYSEKSIVVVGNTYEIKDSLKDLGGRFNKFLTVDGEKVAGWVFSKSKENEVSDLLIDYSNEG